MLEPHKIAPPPRGVKHSIPVLEGEQGLGKSTAIRVLHDDKFFGDALPPMGTKDASDYVRGKWEIELSELAFQRKADEEAQKAFISRQEERFRPAYGREEIRYPRLGDFCQSKPK